MIIQMKTLLRLKERKLDQALQAMQAKRQQREAAREATRLAQVAVDESAATYVAREDAIYALILGKVTDQDGIDDTRGNVVQLEKSHAALKDAVERAIHVEARLEEELKAATEAYFKALRVRDKFSLITNDLVTAANAVVEYREEVEVEDLFARPTKKVAA